MTAGLRPNVRNLTSKTRRTRITPYTPSFAFDTSHAHACLLQSFRTGLGIDGLKIATRRAFFVKIGTSSVLLFLTGCMATSTQALACDSNPPMTSTYSMGSLNGQFSSAKFPPGAMPRMKPKSMWIRRPSVSRRICCRATYG